MIRAFVVKGDIPNTDVARYEIGDRVAIMDQSTEGAVWHNLGIYTFAGTPQITLTDRTDLDNYTAPSNMTIGTDLIQFQRLCNDGDVPPGVTIGGGQ
jgi:hypothetical protein